MRFTTFLLASALLAALGTAKGVLASPDDPNPLQAREISPLMTNGERFARGLPPAAPRQRRGSRTGSAKRAGASSGSTPALLAIELFAATNSSSLGYIWNTLDASGIYEIAQSGDDILQLTLAGGATLDSVISEGLLSSQNLDGPAVSGLLYFAAIQGAQDSTPNLAVGSSAYLFSGAASFTAAGSLPDTTAINSFTSDGGSGEASETSIFSIALDGTITAEWVNTDGSTAVTYPFLFGNAAIAWTGDLDAFTTAYGSQGVITPLILRLVVLPG